jgi:hypothetical protein
MELLLLVVFLVLVSLYDLYHFYLSRTGRHDRPGKYWLTEISLCVAGLCGTATHGPCVLVTASLTAFRTAVSILGQHLRTASAS